MDSGVCRNHFVRVLLLVFCGLLAASRVAADGVNFRSEFTYTNSTSDITNENTGEEITSDFTRLRQRYNFDAVRTLFPYLRLEAGAFYELDDSTSSSDGPDVDMEETTTRPYLRLDLDNPLYQAGIEVRRTEIEEEVTGLPDTEKTRDEINTILGWKPADLPEFNLRFFTDHIYDDPETIDRYEKLLTLDSQYQIGTDLELSYLYTRDDIDNDLRNTDSLDQNHTGRIEYLRNFFNGRLSVNSTYLFRKRTFEFSGSAGAEVPILRSAGLFALDDTPDEGALDNNVFLIDGNTTTSAGIDIGLGGDITTLTNIGLDFGFPVEVDKIDLWVDRRLSASVADSFSWDIYTSDDNRADSDWTLVATVPSAPFATFENRFEIFFPTTVTTRYIKVVTRPLSPAVPEAPLFSNIFVTEIEAFRIVTGSQADTDQETIDHSYNLNLLGRLTDATRVGYNFYYRTQDQDFADDRTEMSNDFSLKHIFNQVFSLSSRFSLTDTELGDEDSTNYDYSASFYARYLETLEQTLTYSWRRDDEEEGTRDQSSILLRTNALLYRGWNAFLDLGYTREDPIDEPEITTTLIRTGTNLIPHDKLTINFNYERSEDSQSGEENNTENDWEIQAFFTPTRALSFNARYHVVDRGETKTTLQDYSANWSPFPDGNLQLFFSYNEILRPEEDQKERTIGPSLRWTIGPHAFLDLSYTISKVETETQTVDTNSLNGNLRILF